MPYKLRNVNSYHREFEGEPDRDAIETMIHAVQEGNRITRDWYVRAHAEGADSDQILQATVKSTISSEYDYEDLLTIADGQCEAAIIPMLKACRNIPVVAEESGHEVDDKDLPNGSQRWLIDPIDGTYGFKKGTGDFSITLALQEKVNNKWETRVGVVSIPLHEELYLAAQQHAYLIQRERARPAKVRAGEEAQPFTEKMDDIFRHKKIECVIYTDKSDKKPEWVALRDHVMERLEPYQAQQSTLSTAMMIAKMADNWVDGAIIAGAPLQVAWDVDAAIHIAKVAGIKTKEIEIDGEPCLLMANSQSLLRAMEQMTKQEYMHACKSVGKTMDARKFA